MRDGTLIVFLSRLIITVRPGNPELMLGESYKNIAGYTYLWKGAVGRSAAERGNQPGAWRSAVLNLLDMLFNQMPQKI
jgi:hypothetical protein